MSEVKDKCPKCGNSELTDIKWFKEWECGSTMIEETFQESKVCGLNARIAELEAACQGAAKVFRDYQQLHLRKGTPDGRWKSDANGAHAEALEKVAPYPNIETGGRALASTEKGEG